MIRDIYEVLMDDMKGIHLITEDMIIHLIGIYGLTRLHNAGLLEQHFLSNGDVVYSLKPMRGAE